MSLVKELARLGGCTLKKMKLAVVNYFWVCLTLAVALWPGLILSVEPADPPSLTNPKCLPNITTSTGARTSGTILSKSFFKCESSSLLTKIFSEDGTTARDELIQTLGNLCAVFVDLTSRVILKGLGEQVCVQNVLGSKNIEERNFCDSLKPLGDTHTKAISEELQTLEYPIIAEEFETLVGMDESTCQTKCGQENDQALCNAFYAMAEFWGFHAAEEESDTNLNSKSLIYFIGSGPILVSVNLTLNCLISALV